MFLKHRGLFALLIIQGSNLLLPIALIVRIIITRSLDFFPPAPASIASVLFSDSF
jgi:hypothetical protein